jgi:transposase
MASSRTRRAKRTPSPEWTTLQARLIWPEQIAYEEVRPVVAFNQPIKERAEELGVSAKTLSRKIEQFVQHGIPGLVSSTARRMSDRRLVPQSIRDYILQLKAEYAAFSSREIASIVEVQFDRAIDHHTVERVLTRGTLPKVTGRRYPRYYKMPEPEERREALLRLHLEGWSVRAISGYLGAPRRSVYRFLTRWADEGVHGLPNKSHARRPGSRKVTLPIAKTIKELQEESAIGAFRMAAALKQHYGIELSPATCGRIMATNRELYHLPETPRKPPTPKKPMPFATAIPHRWWSVDLCYIEQHHLPGLDGPAYIWSILDNASRQIVASAPSKTQNLWDFLLVLFTAVHVHGAPIGLVSDGGGVFKANAALELYQRMGIEKAQIERRRPWQNHVESSFNVMKHMEADKLGQATSWEAFCAVHARWVADYNHQSVRHVGA